MSGGRGVDQFADLGGEAIAVDGLAEVVGRAGPHGGDGTGDGPATGEHQHGHQRGEFAGLSQDRQAVGFRGEVQIADEGGERARLESLEGLAARARGDHAEIAAPQQGRCAVENIRFIVHQQQRGGRHGWLKRRGKEDGCRGDGAGQSWVRATG